MDLALLRLMQLASPALPIGMYSYSQGLEMAVEDGYLRDEAAVRTWLAGLLQGAVAHTDLPMLARLYDAFAEQDPEEALRWSQMLLAFRETSELRQEDQLTGQALARVLTGFGLDEARPWLRHPGATLAALFALAGVAWSIAKPDLLGGYAWGWLENQVLCAIKLVPLGQASGQRVLANLSGLIPAAADLALTLGDEDLGASSPALALLSSRHEVQYSRLFRS